jgi:hypothetical protein
VQRASVQWVHVIVIGLAYGFFDADRRHRSAVRNEHRLGDSGHVNGWNAARLAAARRATHGVEILREYRHVYPKHGHHAVARVLEPRAASDFVATKLVANESEATELYRLTKQEVSAARLDINKEWLPADGGLALRTSPHPRRETVERIAPNAKVEFDLHVETSLAQRTKTLAAKRDDTVSSIAQQCWTRARKQVLAARDLADIDQHHDKGESTASLFVILPAADATELEAKADELNSSIDAIFDAALATSLPALERQPIGTKPKR